MVMLRPSARWAGRWVNQRTRSSHDIYRPQLLRHAHRRGYASQGSHHGAKKSGSDLPWIITSVGITAPATWYLIQPQLKSGHDDGHGHGEEGHGHNAEDQGDHIEDSEPGELVPNLRKGESEDAGAEEDESTSEKGAEEESEKESEKSDSEDDEEQQTATPDTSDDDELQNTAHETDSGGNVEGVQFKGATSGGSGDGEQGDTRKHIPDAKGGNKLRIESHYGKRQGVAGEDHEDPDQPHDSPAQSKAPGGMQETQSGKQEGLSNTDTKHSTDITNNPEKSTKGEGGPETAKLKGTVDPNRPQK